MIEAPQPRRRRRWPLIVAALAVVVTVAGAAGWWFTGGAETLARLQWQPPEQTFLSSMRVQPVAGWTADATALGLPAGATITTDNIPRIPGPIIETSGAHAFLVARSPGPTAPQWWLAGVDAGDGRAMFQPVALNVAAVPPSCFLNGPAVVCISDDQHTATAWVIDGRSGTLTHSGPTDVRLITGRLKAAQAGNYLVAATEGEGLYGVGPNAETTWFQPGAGVVGAHDDNVAFEGADREGSATLFSLEDGSLITPELPDGTDFETSAFFQGGFVVEFAPKGGSSFFQFFDLAGRLTSDDRVGGQYIGGITGNVTALVESDGFGIYGPSGDKLLDVSGDAPQGMQLIGTTLWVGERSNVDADHFQPYDLRTGDEGKPCGFDAVNGYLGTDGSVFVRAPWNLKSDDVAQAYDLATCDLVWSIPRVAGSLGRVLRVGDTLVQLSDDGTELMSLVAPS